MEEKQEGESVDVTARSHNTAEGRLQSEHTAAGTQFINSGT